MLLLLIVGLLEGIDVEFPTGVAPNTPAPSMRPEIPLVRITPEWPTGFL
jgi:hypothetical protein